MGFVPEEWRMEKKSGQGRGEFCLKPTESQYSKRATLSMDEIRALSHAERCLPVRRKREKSPQELPTQGCAHEW
jgi:hypothetical protein